MRPALPWLRQGDVFREVPVLHFEVVAESADTVAPRLPRGPAVLITNNCTLDKRNRFNELESSTIHFCPLLSMSSIDENRRGSLRSQKVIAKLHVGNIGEFGDAYIDLVDLYPLPFSFFRPELDDFTGHAERDSDDPFMVTAKSNASRVGTLDEPHIAELNRKQVLFWTRTPRPHQP